VKHAIKQMVQDPVMPASAARSVSPSYRPDIDGLRAAAVLAVILFHAYRVQVTGGFVGVDAFFVISGFLISGIIWDGLDRGVFGFARFYARRIRRLFPALSVVLLFCLGYGWFVLLPVELSSLGQETLWGAGFLSNVLLWQQAGYFDRAAVTKPLLHLWSLGVEEQFYIVWPFALWAVHRTKANRTGFLAIVMLSSFALNVLLIGTDPTAAFYSPLTRFWEFGSGALIASQASRPVVWLNAVLSQARRIEPRLNNWASCLGLVLIVASVALLNERMAFPGWLALPPVAGTVLIIAAGPQAWLNRVVLAHRVPVYFGLISYPLYLWHWPLISYSYILNFSKAPRELPALGLVVASIVLAALTYEFVERPIRFGGGQRGKTFALIVSMCVVAGIGTGLWQAGGVEARFRNLPNIAIAQIEAAATDPIFKATKDMKLRQDGIVRIAEIGSGPETVLFAGDSLLFQFGPRVQQLYSQGKLHKTVVFVAGPSCPPIPGIFRPGPYAACHDMPRIMAEQIESRHIGIVVLGGNWAIYPGFGNEVERNGVRVPTATPPGSDDVFANLEDEVAGLEKSGHKVFLILPTPASERFAPRNMVSRSLGGVRVNPAVRNGVPVAELRAGNAEMVRRLSGIAAKTGARVLDPLPDICGEGPLCSAFFGDGDPKFIDTMHMRPSFVADHVTFFDSFLVR
jgi:peptidoglycan/LPS O-acetylase OafA/YrhL